MATTQQQLQLLRQGSRGNDVSAIQQALKGYGFYGGVVDGLFGPKTAKAVKDFQNMTGIKVDAIVGPQTRGKIEEWGNNPQNNILSDPRVQELAQTDETFRRGIDQLSQGGNQSALLAGAYELGNKGYYFGPDTWISQENMQPFFDIAKKELDPAFNEALDFYKSDFMAGLEQEKANYEDRLKDTQDQIFNQKINLDSDQAQTNNIDSSLGATQREMFTDSSNRNLSGLERNAKYSLSNLARQFERDYGTNDVEGIDTRISRIGRVSDIGKYIPRSGTRSAYNPIGNIQGGLRRQYASQVEQYGKQKAGTQFGYPVQ
jgi:hypothetical protein